MSNVERPDLTSADPAVRAYVERLEAEVARLRMAEPLAEEIENAEPLEPQEPPTTLQVVTVSAGGVAKRTPRHLYDRQRRGGMGIFDLELPADDAPAFVAVLDIAHDLVVFTNEARAFNVPVDRLAETPVRGRGQPLLPNVQMRAEEHIAAVLPAGRGSTVALLSERGYVRTLPGHVIGQSMTPGTTLFRHAEYGALTAACWTSGSGDLFVASQRGMAIRFPERGLPLPGGLGLRLEAGDRAVAIEAVQPPDGEALFLLGSDGRGTIRLMAGFAANKAPGGGGKTALKTDELVGVVAVEQGDDLFILSRLSKMIRFRASEVPGKEGVVQGVNCMALRADSCVAIVAMPAQIVALEG